MWPSLMNLVGLKAYHPTRSKIGKLCPAYSLVPPLSIELKRSARLSSVLRNSVRKAQARVRIVAGHAIALINSIIPITACDITDNPPPSDTLPSPPRQPTQTPSGSSRSFD